MAREFPTKRVRARRDFAKILGVAKAHALLRQYRRRTDDEVVTAKERDIEIAKRLCQGLWKSVSPRLANVAGKLSVAFGRVEFTPKMAAGVLGYDTDAMRRVLNELHDAELVIMTREHKGTKGSTWRVIKRRSGSTLVSGKTGSRTKTRRNKGKSSQSGSVIA